MAPQAHTANCPNCAGEVRFSAGQSLLTICGYCESAVARVGGDVGKLEILGKVAPLTAVPSRLRVGLSGRCGQSSFIIVGRVQLDYGLGPWNEWYAAFDDGRWGWVAEAQGRVYLTFPREPGDLPGYGHWRPGTHFDFGGMQLTITERRKAKFVSGEGELPFVVPPGAEFYYCDAEGANGAFATLDFGTDQTLEAVFVGTESEYGALFDLSDLSEPETSEALGAALNCPKCAAPIEIQAPGETMRVSCTTCDALLDATEGNTLFLIQGAQQSAPSPTIPLGSTCCRDKKDWTVHGYLVRGTVVYGVHYRWREYLLRSKEGSYRWLTENDGHYSWVSPVSAGAVSESSGAVEFSGTRFRHFQSTSATVEGLKGEFYWKVAVDDKSTMTDYAAPPYFLSSETTAKECNWTVGEYLPKAEVEALFGVQLPDAVGIAPNMPNPFATALKSMSKSAIFLSSVLIILAMAVSWGSAKTVLLDEELAINRNLPPKSPDAVFLSEPFKVAERSNLEVAIVADARRSWLYAPGALIKEASDEIRTFSIEIEGKAWKRIVFGGVAPGEYRIRIDPQYPKSRPKPQAWRLRVREDIFVSDHAWFTLFLVWLGPIIWFFRRASFEQRRWAQGDGEDAYE